MKLTKNFTREEFDCRDGTRVPDDLFCNLCLLVTNLQTLRDEIGIPLFISSGYRTKRYNKAVGGAKSSQHLLAKAADLSVKQLNPLQLAAVIERLIKEKKMLEGGVGVYRGFVHYDVRGIRARW